MHTTPRRGLLTASLLLAWACGEASSTSSPGEGPSGPDGGSLSDSSTGGATDHTGDAASSGAGTAGAAGAVSDAEAGPAGATAETAHALDRVIFGNAESEASHSLSSEFPTATEITKVPWDSATPAPTDPPTTQASDSVVGGLAQTARRLLPRTPNGDVYGGQLTFTMKVDPVAQNYFTVKMWGGPTATGFLVLNVNGKEVGARHGAAGLDEDALYFLDTGWYAGRFFYRTEPLPLSMTRGQTSATITIRSLGSINDYAPIHTYVPQYQRVMTAPSPSVYIGYTHAGAIVDVAGEVQGSAPAVPTPRTSETEAAALSSAKSNVTNALTSKLNADPGSLNPADLQFLARCYDAKEKLGQTWISYPGAKTAATLVNQAIAAIDAQVTAQSANSAYLGTHGNDSWGGYFGPMGTSVV